METKPEQNLRTPSLREKVLKYEELFHLIQLNYAVTMDSARVKAYLDNIRLAVTAAHKKYVPVIYVVVGFREGFPEVSANNKSFSTLKDSMRKSLVDPSPVFAPIKDDLVVIKHRVSAFSGSDLEILLRA